MMRSSSPSDISQREIGTSDLVKEALAEAKELVQIEIALAKEELYREAKALKVTAIAFASAIVAAILGLALILVGVGVAAGWVIALVAGVVLVIGAGITAFVGYKRLPKKPMAETQRRLVTDEKMLKEHLS